MNSLLSRNHWSTQDRGWCKRANALGRQSLVLRYFSTISRLGDGVFWYGLMVVFSVFFGAAGAKAAVHLAATGIVSLLLYKGLKRWTRRPRPFASDISIKAWIAPLDEFSFPSGHTLHAVTFTLLAIAYFPMSGWLLIPFTASVALSRVILGLHYPSDVAAATVIGSLLASLSLWMVPGASLLQ
jgi:undecaprenyl-diphosphatase